MNTPNTESSFPEAELRIDSSSQGPITTPLSTLRRAIPWEPAAFYSIRVKLADSGTVGLVSRMLMDRQSTRHTESVQRE